MTVESVASKTGDKTMCAYPMQNKPMTRNEKREYIRARISGLKGTGLEIGPHIDPLFRRSKGDNVVYLETRSASQLRQLCTKQGKDPQRVEEIDYIFSGQKTLKGLIADRTFPWVVSSHVIEHIPDFVGHLQEIQEILEPGGAYHAIIPDKALCFDCLRPHSTLGEVLEKHLTACKSAPLRTVIDDIRYSVRPRGVSVGGWTAAQAKTSSLAPARPQRHRQLLDILKRPAANYPNWKGHYWRFTPHSFLHLAIDLFDLGLLKLAPVDICPTGNMDFIATLSTTPPPAAHLAALAESLVNYEPPTYPLPIGDLPDTQPRLTCSR
jgi:hypothetical protein